jgi:hypothetical protein
MILEIEKLHHYEVLTDLWIAQAEALMLKYSGDAINIISCSSTF